MDPDSEIITATTATSGNTGDAEPAEPLLADIFDDTDHGHPLALSVGEPLDFTHPGDTASIPNHAAISWQAGSP